MAKKPTKKKALAGVTTPPADDDQGDVTDAADMDQAAGQTDQADVTAPADDAEPELTAADVVDLDALYGPGRIESLLAIPVATTQEAIRQRQIRYEHFGDGDRIRGRSLLYWIEAQGVRHQITDLAGRVWRLKHPKPAPPPPEGKSVGERVRKMLGEAARDDRDRAEREAANAWDSYLTALVKGDDAEEQDIRVLIDASQELGISPQGVEEDLRLIQRARMLAELHDQRDDAQRTMVEANAAYKAMEKRHKEEEKAAWQAKRNAHTQLSQAGEARFELGKLARRRPQFFTAGDAGADSPPRLRDPSQL